MSGLTKEQIAKLEELGFYNFENNKKRYHKETKRWSIQVNNGVLIIGYAPKFPNWYDTQTTREYAPWVKRDLLELAKVGIK